MTLDNKLIIIPGITGQNESFICEDVLGDGNCFYSAIAKLVKKDSRQHGAVRAALANHIYTNWNDFKGSISDEDFKKACITINTPVKDLRSGTAAEQEYLRQRYKDLISTHGTWGDEISLKAASAEFKVNVIVVENGKVFRQYPDPNHSNLQYRKTIYVRYENKNHYQPLINLKEHMAKILADNIPENAILTELAFAKIVGLSLIINNKQRLEEELLVYLRTKSDTELRNFYNALLKLHINTEESYKQKRQYESLDRFSGIIKYFLDIFSSPSFAEGLIKLFAAFRSIFHKFMVSLNPGVELDEEEKKGPNEQGYGKIFNMAGEEGRKIYRKLIDKTKKGEISLTNEQFLNVLLHKLKKDKKGLFSKIGHEIVTKIEKKIFDGKSFRELGHMIQDNLSKAQRNAHSQSIADSGYVYGEEFNAKLKIITANFMGVSRKILTLTRQITDKNNGFSNTEKATLWKILQYDRLKLLHFVLKTKAFSENKVLTPNKKEQEQIFKAVFQKFLSKFEYSSINDIYNGTMTGIDIRSISVLDSEQKSLLKLFVNGNLSQKLVSEGKFIEAITKANEGRGKDIKKIQDDQKNKIKIVGEELNTTCALIRGETIVSIVSQVQPLITEIKELLEQVNRQYINNVLNVNEYNKAKEQLRQNDLVLKNLEQRVAMWINMIRGNNNAAVRAQAG